MVRGGQRGWGNQQPLVQELGEVMNLVSGDEYEGYDCVTFEMDNVKLRTIMTIQWTRRTRGGQRETEGARGGGGRNNIIPRILSHQRGSWGWWGEKRLVHESRCTKPQKKCYIIHSIII